MLAFLGSQKIREKYFIEKYIFSLVALQTDK
jgi:hypothetical protein